MLLLTTIISAFHIQQFISLLHILYIDLVYFLKSVLLSPQLSPFLAVYILFLYSVYQFHLFTICYFGFYHLNSLILYILFIIFVLFSITVITTSSDFVYFPYFTSDFTILLTHPIIFFNSLHDRRLLSSSSLLSVLTNLQLQQHSLK